MSYSLITKDLDGAIKEWGYFITVNDTYNYHTCYEYYYSHKEFKGDGEYIFSFLFLPKWYRRIIRKFNKSFKNIQIIILGEKILYAGRSLDEYNDSSFVVVPKHFKGDVEVICPLFKIDFNSEYSNVSKFYLRFLIHQLLRMLSPQNTEYIKYDQKEFKPSKDSLEYLVELNNENVGELSFSEDDITRNMLLKLDDIDTVNKKCEILDYSKVMQTDLFKILISGDCDFKFKIGDIVTGTEDSNEIYGITCERMLKGMIINTSFTKMSVKVLEMIKDLNSYEGTIFYELNPDYFRLVEDK
jgi:hypothetical protein